MIRSAAFPPLLVALLAAACARDTATQAVRLGEFAGFQAHQVTTTLVDAGWDRDRDLEPGWAVGTVPGAEGELLTLTARNALLAFFVAEPSDLTLEVEAHWAGPAQPIKVGFLVNEKRLQRAEPIPGTHIYSIPIPASALLQGRNVLRVQARSDTLLVPESGPALFGIRRLRWLADDGAAARRGDPAAEIRFVPATDPDDAYVEMPNASFFDVVTRLPPNARLRGSLRALLPPGQGSLTATARVSLTTETAPRRELFTREFAPGDRSGRELDVALDLAAGTLVELRFEVSGPAEAIVRWRDPVLSGDAGASPQPAATESAPGAGSNTGRPDIVLVLLDAARADAFSVYGGPYPTPAIDRLAADGTLFEHTRAPSSWTGQSVPAIFTGLGPNALGIGHWDNRIAPETPTLAELMTTAGYSTTLWSQHPFYGWHKDLQRGFSVVRTVGTGPFDGAALAGHLAVAPSPAFTFVHLIPPHAPYAPPEPFAGSRSDWYDGDVPATAKFLNAFSVGRADRAVDDDDLRYIRDRYLENAEYADSLVGDLVASLETLGRYDQTLIAVLADHGEGFLEHGQFLHTRELYDEFVRVPLVVKWPAGLAGPGPRVERSVSLLDLVPTLVEITGVADPPPSQGESLLRPPPPGRAIFTATRGDSSRGRNAYPSLAIEVDGWKAIYRPLIDTTELYHLAEDPAETLDLAAERPLVARQLRQRLRERLWLDRQLAKGGSVDASAIDPAAVEELRALGYLN